ncbi:MAG: endonuclease/exonuclease/phosphatase family protein [Planctomycetota bacterium]
MAFSFRGPRAIGVSLATVVASFLLLTATCDAQPILVDGSLDDWGDGSSARADANYVYLRLVFEDPLAMGGAGKPIKIHVDADGDAETGFGGAEVTITYSDPTQRENRRWAPRVRIFDQQGELITSPPASQVDLHAAPTWASDVYELRFTRTGHFRRALGEIGRGRVTVTFGDETVLDAEPLDFVQRASRVPPADVIVPAKPAGGLRVMAWNVLWGSPVSEPDAFARILEATKPDVVLIQEWDRGEATPADISRWFDTHAAWGREVADRDWDVSDGEAWGVAIATPHAIVATDNNDLFAPGTRWDFPVRLASAVIETPLGRVATGSLHLKCCGTLASEEDRRRIAEARAINAVMSDLASDHGASFMVLGGDFNANGTRDVLDLSAAELDTDGSSLAWAEAVVLGQSAAYTHGRPESDGPRSRLDFIGYPDAGLRAVNSFVLDTWRLSDASLRQAGLQRRDSQASDHLPVIVDLVPR